MYHDGITIHIREAISREAIFKTKYDKNFSQALTMQVRLLQTFPYITLT